MNKRLEQAEARLAASGPTQGQKECISSGTVEIDRHQDPPSTKPSRIGLSAGSNPISMSIADFPNGVQEYEEPQFALNMNMDDWVNAEFADFNFEIDTDTHDTTLECLPNITTLIRGFDQHAHVGPQCVKTVSTTPNNTMPSLSPELRQGLCDRYFDLFHPIMPIVRRNRFDAEISQATPSTGVQALSFAMAVLGCFSIPELHYHVEACYEKCRSLIDLCERGTTDNSLANFNTLQALALLILYEFKQPNFARGWITLGRAIRLAKMMGLDHADTYESQRTSTAAVARWSARLRLPPPSDGADAEERRRTFWLLYIYDAYSNTQINEGSAFNRAMYIPLPSPLDFSEEFIGSNNMPSVHQLFASNGSIELQLSSFAANAVMVSLYRHCIENILSRLPSRAPDTFWNTYYAIDKLLTHCPFRMNLASVEISLHETALIKIQEEKLPSILAIEAMSKCRAAAIDIAKAVKLSQQLTGKKLEVFKQHDIFLVWPMTTSIQIISRILEEKKQAEPILIEYLYQISKAMKDLVCPEHIRPGLLYNVESR